MKHKLNSFSGAFEGTTKGLEGIANALKREEPTPPPYVPTGFPTGIKFSNTENDNYLLIRWNSSRSLTKIDSNVSNIKLDAWPFENTYILTDQLDRVTIRVDSTTFSVIKFQSTIFNHYEWIDPSTLPPQS